MPKVTLTDIVAGYQLKEAYNANNDALAAAIENTLSRDGTTPNQMEAQLDMNSNKVINLPNGTNAGDAVNFAQLQSAVTLGGGAASDHGLLSGLNDDDHTQYHTDARGDARYPLHAEVVKLTGNQSIAGEKSFTEVAFFEETLHVGAEGIEPDSIRIDNVERPVRLKASSLGTGNPASVLAHQHSTTAAPEYLFSRSNSTGAGHAAVINGMKLGSNVALGWAHGTPGYLPAAEIKFEVDASGTVGATSMPGRIVLATTKDGEKTPTAALTIDRSQVAEFLATPTVGGTAVSLTGHTHVEADITDLQTYALDSAVVHLAGAETIGGLKTFSLEGTPTQAQFTRNNPAATSKLGFANVTGALGNIGFNAAGQFIQENAAGSVVWRVNVDGVLGVGSVPWANLTGTPTTLSGYGITDAVNNWGTQTIAGQKTFEATSGNTLLTVQKQADSGQAVLDFRDEAGVQRNIFGLAGGAADDFFIGRYSAAGAWQGSTMYVPAATGIADFQYTPTAGGVALALSNAVVNLTAAQTVAGVKTFSSAPRTHRAAADMVELWRTDATADDGRWVFQVGADGAFDLLGLTDAGVAGQVAMRIARTGAALVPAVNLYANGVVVLATQQYNTGDATTGAVVRHRNGGFYDVGMNVTPVTNIDGADLTLSSSHVGGLIRKWDTAARNLNIPASTDVDIPIGAWFEYHGWNPGVVTLVGGAGVTISWFTGSAVTAGNRSFAQGSSVKIWRVDAARWHVSGIGIS